MKPRRFHIGAQVSGWVLYESSTAYNKNTREIVTLYCSAYVMGDYPADKGSVLNDKIMRLYTILN